MMTLSKKGLSLIEVLIAISIMAFMMIAVISITNTSLDRKDVIVSEDREVLQIETALDRMDWDFSQIYTPLNYAQEFKIDPKNQIADKKKSEFLKGNPLYSRQALFHGPAYYGHPIPKNIQKDKSDITFFTKGNRRRVVNNKESHFAWVQYTFRDYTGENEEKKGTKELLRYYSPLDIYNSSLDIKEVKPFILADGITDFKLSFWDPKSEKFVDNVRSVENGDKVIKAMKVEINWVRSSGVEEYTSRTYRTIWPEFEPEDLTKVKYQDADGNAIKTDEEGNQSESATTEQ